jgi:hypothetical protein
MYMMPMDRGYQQQMGDFGDQMNMYPQQGMNQQGINYQQPHQQGSKQGQGYGQNMGYNQQQGGGYYGGRDRMH